jgi:hypothetical protein
MARSNRSEQGAGGFTHQLLVFRGRTTIALDIAQPHGVFHDEPAALVAAIGKPLECARYIGLTL